MIVQNHLGDVDINVILIAKLFLSYPELFWTYTTANIERQ